MKRLIAVIVLLSATSLSASGFDDMMLWRLNLPALSQKTFSFQPFSVSQDGLNAIFLHADPYRINSLYWDYAAVKYGMTRWGIYGSARFYGVKDLYSTNQIVLGAAFIPYPRLAVALSLKHEMEQFAGTDNYSRIDLDAKISGNIGRFTGLIDLDKINLEKPYDFPGVATPEPMIYASYKIDEHYQASIGVRRLNSKTTRWLFNQDVNIVDGVGLRLGYYNSPNVFNWGLDINWRMFTFDFTYFAMSRLNDTLALGLSFAM